MSLASFFTKCERAGLESGNGPNTGTPHVDVHLKRERYDAVAITQIRYGMPQAILPAVGAMTMTMAFSKNPDQVLGAGLYPDRHSNEWYAWDEWNQRDVTNGAGYAIGFRKWDGRTITFWGNGLLYPFDKARFFFGSAQNLSNYPPWAEVHYHELRLTKQQMKAILGKQHTTLAPAETQTTH